MVADNPTLCVKSDYNLKFSTNTGINEGEAICVNIFPDFDISEADLTNVKLTINGEDYTGEVTTNDAFQVTVTSEVYANEEITLFIPDVLNPSYVSNDNQYSFGTVSINDSGKLATVELYKPELTITPDHDTIEVNLRDKITIALKDKNGNDFLAPYPVQGVIYGSGEFYAQPTDLPQLGNPASFEISQGSSCTEIYYFRPTWVGDNGIYAYTNAETDFLGILTATGTINVIVHAPMPLP